MQVTVVDVLLPYAIPIGFLCLTLSFSFLFFMHETVSSLCMNKLIRANRGGFLTETSPTRAVHANVAIHVMKCGC